MVTLLAVAGGAYALWQLDQTQQVMKSQSVRIAQLEDKLALSDDSATQSLTSIGAKVRELNIKSVKVTTEIDKLWATRNVNRNAIAASDKKIAVIEKKQGQLTKLKTTITDVNKKVADLLPIKTSAESTAQRVTEQDLLLQSVRERVANHSESLKTLSSKADAGASALSKVNGIDKRLKSTEEAMTSIDAFRRTVNRDLLQLKQTKK
jgi:chromosome segregation ATPase